MHASTSAPLRCSRRAIETRQAAQVLVAGARHSVNKPHLINYFAIDTQCRYQDSRREELSAPTLTPPESLTESVGRLVVQPVIRAAPWDPQRLEQQERNPEASILLISESGVCRSVLAAACLRQLLAEAGLGGAVRVATCATRPYNLGEGPEPSAVAAAEALGLELPDDHTARLFNPAHDIVSHDLLLTMDKFTAGDVMREVSSFDLVNRDSQFAFKVRRLGEFLGGPAATGSAAEYGSEGEELDIEDPLYGNVGGEEEERAVVRSGRLIREACRGLVAFLRELQTGQEHAAVRPSRAPEEEETGGEEEAACELPLPGQAPICSGAPASPLGERSGEEQDAVLWGQGRGSGSVGIPPLGPALRARVQTMGPSPWLVPPMLAPRGKATEF